jgi:hypothetical protein
MKGMSNNVSLAFASSHHREYTPVRDKGHLCMLSRRLQCLPAQMCSLFKFGRYERGRITCARQLCNCAAVAGLLRYINHMIIGTR